jgi:hypothetical protein
MHLSLLQAKYRGLPWADRYRPAVCHVPGCHAYINTNRGMLGSSMTEVRQKYNRSSLAPRSFRDAPLLLPMAAVILLHALATTIDRGDDQQFPTTQFVLVIACLMSEHNPPVSGYAASHRVEARTTPFVDAHWLRGPVLGLVIHAEISGLLSATATFWSSG